MFTPADSGDLLSQAESLMAGEPDRVANAANLSALLFNGLDDVNWAGFYFARGQDLVVGPFQGNPACVRIPLGRGVCGKSAATREVILVEDVNEFDDHIACDTASRSEIVVPLVKSGELVGVLDIDSPTRGRFSEADEALLRKIAALYIEAID